MKVKELIRTIAEALVDHPEKVVVNEIAGQSTNVVELRVAKEDVGKIIGRQGRTADSIRRIMQAAGVKQRKRVVLEILD